MTKYARNLDWFWPVFLAALGWLWCPLWADSQVPAFRDGFHFYYPQYYWLDRCYRAGEYFPSWNPNEGLGVSVYGQPTWQLLYPLRVLWLVPYLDLPQRTALWIVVHQILAAIGMKRLAERIGLSRRSSWLAGVAFSLSCPVLFQYSNAIYLCSAAWVGWALMPMMRLLDQNNTTRISSQENRQEASAVRRSVMRLVACVLQFAFFTGLMVLAGDPHTAVNGAMIASVALVVGMIRSIAISRSKANTPNEQKRITPNDSPTLPTVAATSCTSFLHENTHLTLFNRMVRRLKLFGITIVFLSVYLLVAVQSACTRDWFSHSSRSGNTRSVTDSFSNPVGSILSAELDQPVQRVFDFSVSPWCLPSFLWPTSGGHYQPEHSRWLDALESEGRMWIPSLYFGLLPLLLVVFGWRTVANGTPNSSAEQFERFLLWISVLTLVAAMGNYSCLWLVRQFMQLLGLADWTQSLPADSSGSLYGLLVQALPGYGFFRYPAKWIVWTVAGLSLVAAIRLDHWTRRQPNSFPLRLPAISIVVLSVAIIVCCTLIPFLYPEVVPLITRWLDNSFDPLLGQARFEEANQQILFAFHWPIVILSLLGIGMIVFDSRRVATLLLFLTLVDLTVCARHWISTTPEPNCCSTNVVGRSSESYWANVGAASINDLPDVKTTSDQSTQITLQESCLIGKLGHLRGVASLHASGPLRPMALVKLDRWLSRQDTLEEHQPELDEVLSHLGVSQRRIRSASGSREWQRIASVRPLCEVVGQSFASQANDSANLGNPTRLNWEWTSNSELLIDVSLVRDSILLIRQYNDQRWRLESSSALNLEPMEGELFIATRVPRGSHQIRLFRKGFFEHETAVVQDSKDNL